MGCSLAIRRRPANRGRLPRQHWMNPPKPKNQTHHRPQRTLPNPTYQRRPPPAWPPLRRRCPTPLPGHRPDPRNWSIRPPDSAPRGRRPQPVALAPIREPDDGAPDQQTTHLIHRNETCDSPTRIGPYTEQLYLGRHIMCRRTLNKPDNRAQSGECLFAGIARVDDYSRVKIPVTPLAITRSSISADVVTSPTLAAHGSPTALRSPPMMSPLNIC